MAETYTYTRTFTYTRSELITDLVCSAFDRALEQLGANRQVPAEGLKAVLERGWLGSIAVVASTPRPDGSSDWHIALKAQIDAETHVARMAIASQRMITLPSERADDIADQLVYYSQIFVKVARRHRQPNWTFGIWWTPSAAGQENREMFNELTGSRPFTVHRAATEKIGQFTPEEIDEAVFGIEVYTDGS